MRSLVMVFVAALLLVCAALCVAPVDSRAESADVADALEGAWLMDEITVISARGEASYPDPQPGLFIFSGGHYSMVWSLAAEPVPDSEEVWHPTDEEKASCFSTLIVNSGTYSVSDTLLTTVPLAAKTPEFVGGFATYRYRVVGDTLWMESTNIVSRDGVVDPGVGKFRLPLRLVRP
jgi:hypothetical protein